MTLSPSTKQIPTVLACVAVLPRHQVIALPVTTIHEILPAITCTDDMQNSASNQDDVNLSSRRGSDEERDAKMGDVSKVCVMLTTGEVGGADGFSSKQDLIPYLSVVLAEDATVAIVSLGAGLGMLLGIKKNPNDDTEDDDPESEEQIGMQLHVFAPDGVSALTGRAAAPVSNASGSSPFLPAANNSKKRKSPA